MTPALLQRLKRFLARPRNEMRGVAVREVRRIFRAIPRMAKIPPGFLFVVWNDAVRDAILSGEFEKVERQFVARYLRHGMTVLDVGAYFGIYSLIASMKVGPRGRVVAFEPSDPQKRRLHFNLILNGSRNVRVETLALSSSEGQAKFFVAIGGAEGFSGLRRPEVGAPIRCVQVKTTTLDNYLGLHRIPRVDLIKVDVEGGELDFFGGARKLLARNDSPVILCELQDIRSRSWGHTARQTADFLQEFGYRWFRPVTGGRIVALSAYLETYEGNFIAVPKGRMESVEDMIEG